MRITRMGTMLRAMLFACEESSECRALAFLGLWATIQDQGRVTLMMNISG